MYSIAIDGPSGSGKSTIAKILAKKLNINYLNTGEMYRGIAYYLKRNNIDFFDENIVEESLQKLSLEVKNNKVFINKEDVSPYLNTSEISKISSIISQYDFIRKFLVNIQRELSSQSSIILDGRDIGSIVLPNAEYKFYLTADLDIRAKRRFEDLSKIENISFYEIKNNIKERDLNDSNRKNSPLIIPEDAIIIDSSFLNKEDVINIMLDKIVGDRK